MDLNIMCFLTILLQEDIFYFKIVLIKRVNAKINGKVARFSNFVNKL